LDFVNDITGWGLDEWKWALAVMNLGLFLAIVAALRHSRWVATVHAASEEAEVERRKTLLVIAHPDDEAMFFAPTLLALGDVHDLYILCLSTGNFDGLGEIRRLELPRSAGKLGVAAERIRIVDHPELQDGMDADWPRGVIAEAVTKAVKDFEIESVVSFDEYGVSGHPNHGACARGVAAWFAATDPEDGYRAWALVSTGLARKFLGFVDILFSILGSDVLLVSPHPTRTWSALACHASQFVWYRRLFVLFSRYSFVNTLRAVAHPSGPRSSPVSRHDQTAPANSQSHDKCE